MRVLPFPPATKSSFPVLNLLQRNYANSQEHAGLSAYVQGRRWTSCSALGHGVTSLRHLATRTGKSPLVFAQCRGYVTGGTRKDGESSEWESKAYSRSPSNSSRERKSGATFSTSEKSSTMKPQRNPNGPKERKKSYASTTPEPPSAPSVKLPARVKGYPTPIITSSDFVEYLKPLYKRGWFVESRRIKAKGGERYYITSLQIQFVRLDWERFFVIAKMVRELEKSEKHHVEWRYSTRLELQSLRTLGLEVPSPISLLIRTHSAIFHHTPEAFRGPLELFSHLPKEMQGITLRDVRLAVLLDELLTKFNAENTSQIQIQHEAALNGWRPQTVDSMLLSPPNHPGLKTDFRRRKKHDTVEDVVYIGEGWEKILDEVGEEGQVSDGSTVSETQVN